MEKNNEGIEGEGSSDRIGNALIMTRTCTFCRQPFTFSDDEKAFLGKMTFRIGTTSVHFPEPEHCPDCRLQLKTCHRNERYLYKGKSALSQKDMVALYEGTAPWGDPYIVYAQDEWHGDGWDAMEKGIPVETDQPFFAQWAKLHKAVPRMGLITVSNENSDFTTGTGYCKNCYLINSSEYCEDCYYGKLLQSSRNCVDCSYAYDCEQCYECLSVYNCHTCTHVLFSKNCSDCLFSSSLIGCKNCLLCTNLRQKEYHIRNKPVSREAFEAELQKLRGSATAFASLQKEFQDMERNRTHRAANIVSSEECTGDYLENCKRCIDCFDLNNSEDCCHAYVGVSVKDLQHCSNMYLKVELCLDVLGAIEVYHSAYCLFCFYCQDLLYSEYCFHCQECFGCVGLKNKRHCIFNVQYTKEEYERIVPAIIERMQRDHEWGMFFPRDRAPFGYNETLAQEYFPLTKEQALAKGFLWHDIVDQLMDVKKVIPAAMLPDRTEDTPDDVLDWAVKCEQTQRPFRIIRQELQFYRSHRLPLPRLHPDVRYDNRLAVRNPRKLWDWPCAKCSMTMQSTYAPDRPETVVCEECYRKEIY